MGGTTARNDGPDTALGVEDHQVSGCMLLPWSNLDRKEPARPKNESDQGNFQIICELLLFEVPLGTTIGGDCALGGDGWC